MKGLKKFLAIPIMLLGLLASCLSPLSIKADDSSAGYIDSNWTGYTKVGFSWSKNEDSGLIAQFHMEKPGMSGFDPVYCYNTERPTPEEHGTSYYRYGFYYGMNNRGTDLGSEDKVNAVAAVLYAGYPNNGLNDLFGDKAKRSYEAFMNSDKRIDVPTNYPFEMFLQDATQEAIWLVDSKISHIPNGGNEFLVDPTKPYGEYGYALVQYALTHPLRPSDIDAKNLKIVDTAGNVINESNTLKANMDNGGFTQEFTISGFSGAIKMTPDTNWEVYDANTNTKVNSSQLFLGKTYKLKYVGSATTASTTKMNLFANYKNLADSYFFEPTGKKPDGKSYQNLVCLNTVTEQKAIAAEVVKSVKTTDVKFNKYEVTGSKELAGAHMQVIDKATNKVVEEWDSTTGGVDHTFKAEEGKEYILKETVAPSGYDVIATTEFKVENGKIQLNGDTNVKVDGKDSTLVLINDRELSKPTTTTKTDVKFNKYEATGSKELVGAHMQVIDKATNKVVEEWDSTASGVDHTFKAEEGKEYILREKTAPKGYDVVSDTEFTVNGGKITVKGDSRVTVDGKDTSLILIKDDIKTTDVKFNKYEVTGSKELAGAHMQVIDKATNKVVEEWDSTTGGVDHTFKAEEGKEYILKETVAPSGYDVIATTEFKVENGKIQLNGDTNVKVDGKDSTLVLINDQLKKEIVKTTDVKFNKYEATGSKELAGAHMQVIDKASGKVVAEWTSNANGIDHTFKAEEGKEYILRETIAPKGYKTIADTTFVVRNGKIQLTGDTNVKINGTDTNMLMINDQLLAKTNKSNSNNVTTRTVKKGSNEMVSTGDNSNVAGLIALGLGSLIVLGVCFIRKQNA